MSAAQFSIYHQHLHLLRDRAMFWEEKRWLMLSDLHLGKAAHFQKAGIPLSAQVSRLTLDRLNHLLLQWQPKRVLFLGDLFHSRVNGEWHEFLSFRRAFASTTFTLVIGNHDILSPALYAEADLEICRQLDEPPFFLTHEPQESSAYNICGHIHPSVVLSGKGKQSVILPCFHFGPMRGILPAFGAFSGSFKMPVGKEDAVFACTSSSVIQVAGR